MDRASNPTIPSRSHRARPGARGWSRAHPECFAALTVSESNKKKSYRVHLMHNRLHCIIIITIIIIIIKSNQKTPLLALDYALRPPFVHDDVSVLIVLEWSLTETLGRTVSHNPPITADALAWYVIDDSQSV
jgi:hypothetical protein